MALFPPIPKRGYSTTDFRQRLAFELDGTPPQMPATPPASNPNPSRDGSLSAVSQRHPAGSTGVAAPQRVSSSLTLRGELPERDGAHLSPAAVRHPDASGCHAGLPGVGVDPLSFAAVELLRSLIKRNRERMS